ncbi:MAG: phosphoribosyltransferase family protein [Acidobacteriota bacterium]|nr:phosphoribosyltransferase family protein [Acidobacteriota bacterium]
MNEARIQRLYDASTIATKVQALGETITQDHPDDDPWVVSIIGGSIVFLADLVRSIRKPIRYETVQVAYSPSSRGEDLLEIHYPISLDVQDQAVVIVKDVVSTGVTETYLVSQFLQGGASKVEIATLLDLPEERRADLETDYRVFSPKRVGTFVGYGLKYEGRYGNLPYLGRIDPGRES